MMYYELMRFISIEGYNHKLAKIDLVYNPKVVENSSSTVYDPENSSLNY